MQEIDYKQWRCIRLANSYLEVLVTTSIGPRIVSCRLYDGINVLAELPDLVIPTPFGDYHFVGGHRLWHAPENMPRTYIPDDSPVDISEGDDGVRLRQPIEDQTGIQKELILRMPPGSALLEIEHVLTNHNLWPILCAPWAITVMKLGGMAILPIAANMYDTLLPNCHLVLWPYSSLADNRLSFGTSFILIQGSAGPRFKMGFSNPSGWLAYWHKNGLFVKKTAFQRDKTYPDRGSSSECFVNDHCLELETLGPLSTLDPGAKIHHIEQWLIFRTSENPPADEASVIGLLRQIGLIESGKP